MLTQVLSNLLPWFRVRIRIHSQQTLSRLYWIKTQHSWLKTTRHTKRKEPHNGILGLKSLTCFRLQISLKANQFYLPKSRFSLRFLHVHWCFCDKTDSISPSFSSWGKYEHHHAKKKKSIHKTKISYICRIFEIDFFFMEIVFV